MTREDRQRWNDRYQADERWQSLHAPSPWLVEHAPPSSGGLALDVACGLGHNTLWLAGQGYRVIGLDGSLVALRRGLEAARREGLAGRVCFVQADMDHVYLPPACFDLIAVIRFLSRDLFPALAAALRPGGRLIYATLNWRYLESHPEIPAIYLLSPGELERAFAGLDIVDVCEQDDMTCLAACKPPGK